MQIQTIKRPTLFSDFFNLELIWSNDYLEYIQTNNHSSVTSLPNNSRNLLIPKYDIIKRVMGIYKHAMKKRIKYINTSLIYKTRNTRLFHKSLKISLSSDVP